VSGQDAYKLSMPLMASGVLGDRGLYNVIEHYMSKSLKKLEEESSYTDWLRGRMLMADLAMNGKVTRNDILIPLQRHVEFAQKIDPFMAWAAGYLAVVDYRNKDRMLKILTELTNNPSVSKSDKVWAWVLAMHAAAQANDTGTYLKAMDQINQIAGQSNLSQSLPSVLLRTPESSDYPAWALALARLSAATIGDSSYFTSLDAAMNQSLDEAKRDAQKDYKARAERLLAEVNNRLAIQRNQGLEACKSGVNPEACGH
jgi:hypothetical protein